MPFSANFAPFLSGIVMRKYLLAVCLSATALSSQARLFEKNPKLSGMYFQWGYHRIAYTKSTINFVKPGEYDFTIHDAVAKDKPDFQSFWKSPLDITIPQNVYRIGFYLNKAHTHAIEINFDHAKYVVKDYQQVHVTGEMYGNQVDKDTVFTPAQMHFEHTNGANFYLINYVGQREILRNKKNTRTLATVLWKAGAGIMIPKSDITLFHKRLDNRYHVAGYMAALEGGARFYFAKKFFLEATVKGGYANYANVLTVDGGHASHQFGFVSGIGTVGYDINFGRKKKAEQPAQ